jgi:hypothetical protein
VVPGLVDGAGAGDRIIPGLSTEKPSRMSPAFRPSRRVTSDGWRTRGDLPTTDPPPDRQRAQPSSPGGGIERATARSIPLTTHRSTARVTGQSRPAAESTDAIITWNTRSGRP